MDLGDRSVMVIGSGDTAELALKSLVEKGAREVIVVNRTVDRAQALADAYQGEAMPLERLDQHLHRADIVICSTGSPQPILHATTFQHALRERNREPMFVIDIALPRDVDNNVNDLDNVYLYNLDDLQAVADQNLETRRREAEYCLSLIEAQTDKFMAWRRSLYAEPTIVSMIREWHAIRERELEKTLDALPELNDKQREEVEYLTKRIVNNLLQRPMTNIKTEVSKDDPNRVLLLVKRLFGIEETS